MGEHIAIERIQRGVVDVRGEDAFFQIVEVMCPAGICGVGAGEARFVSEDCARAAT